MADINQPIGRIRLPAPALVRPVSTRPVFKQASAGIVTNSLRILNIFKPDALALNAVPLGLKFLGQGLTRENIAFRFAGLTLFNANQAMVDGIYAEHVGKGWYEHGFKPFMTGENPHPAFHKTPLIGMMVEMKNDPARDLVRTIREKVIGPTDPESEKDPQASRDTVRYQLTLGQGLRIWPLGDDPNGPMNNRMHCSASRDAARDELRPIYGTGELFRTQYDEAATDEVLGEFRGDGPLPQGIVRIPLFEYLGSDPVASAIEISHTFAAQGISYKDFSRQQIETLLRELNGMSHLFSAQEDLFRAASSYSPAQVGGFMLPAPSPVKPRVIALFGAPGSGKTTLADQLKARGLVQGVVPLIVNEEREKDGAHEYQLLPKAELLKRLREGELLGWETLSDNLYAVSNETVDLIVGNPGKTFVIIAGPSIVYPLQQALGARADFYQVMVSVPGHDLSARIEARGTGRDLTRGADLSLQNQAWLTGQVGNFDLTVTSVSGRPEADADRIADFLLRSANAPVDRTLRDSTLIGMQLNNLMDLVLAMKDGMDFSDIERQESVLLPLLNEPVKAILRSVRLSLPVATDVGVDDINGLIAELAPHIDLVASAGLQLRYQTFEQLVAKPIRFGRIGMAASRERARALHARLKAVQNSIDEREELLFALIHDIGKMANIPDHAAKGREIAERLGLFKGWDIPGLDPEVNLLAVQHSHLVGSHLLPETSLAEVAEELAKPDVKAVLATPSGGVNLARLKKYLDRICLFPCKDVLGYGQGWLRGMFAEGYLDFGDQLYSLFAKHPDNYEAAIDEIREQAPASNRDRILRFVAAEDMEADAHGRTFDYYWNEIIEPRVGSAIKQGFLTTGDWQAVLTDLHHIRKFGYAITLLTDFFLFVGAPSDKFEDLNNYGNFFKFFSILVKSLRGLSENPTRPDDFDFRFVTEQGRDILGYHDPQSTRAMALFSEQLSLANGAVTVKGKSLTLEPRDPSQPPKLEIFEELVNGRRTITVKIPGIA